MLAPFLPLLFVNCSAGLEAISTPSEEATDFAPTPTEFATIESSGRILAFQDLNFRLAIPGAGAGVTYALENAPAWVTLDSLAGEVVGLPTTASVATDFKIKVTDNGTTTTLGPYVLVVIEDPLKAHQWHLQNTGQNNFSGTNGVAGNDVHLTDTISKLILGSGIRIAISDTGIQESHPNLRPNLIPGASRNYAQNFNLTQTWVGNSSPPSSIGGYAHGTAVAGIAAERGWMGSGGRGVAPLAGLAGFYFIPAQSALIQRGLLNAATYDQFAGAFDIFNYSWGDPQCMLNEYPDALRDKMKTGATNLRGGKGAIYVKAAGNDFHGYLADCSTSASDSDPVFGNANFSEDSTSPYTINVGALSAKGQKSSYSSPGSNIWVSAPGGEYGLASSSTAIYKEPAMLTTDFQGCSSGIKRLNRLYNPFEKGTSPNGNCRHTSTMNGTSSAAPVVAGAAALLLSANPNLTWRDVKHIFAVTADQVHASVGVTTHPMGGNLAGHDYEQGWVTNDAGYAFHNWYGFGRINVDAAVTMAKTYVSTLGPLQETNSGNTWTIDSGPINLAITGGSITGTTSQLNVPNTLTVEAVQVRVAAADCIGAIGLELTSPRGTKNILMNINSRLLDDQIESHIFLSNAFYGEASNGPWTLKAIGGMPACNSTLKSWQINVIGH